MKQFKLIIFVLVIIFSAAYCSIAQEASTQGTEFWVSFMGNGYKENHTPNYVDTQLLISSKHDCTGSITNPLTGWTDTFIVEANSITSIDIPNEQAYNETSSYERVAAKGLKVITSDTVTVYCTNIAANSFDASYVLPIQALADDYIIQTFDQSMYINNSTYAGYLTSAFLIVGVEDNTTVDITPSVSTLGNKPAGEEFSITLKAGETYQVRSNTGPFNRDLTGTRVTARNCKKIAVFNGNTLTAIPYDYGNGFDHVFEQAMPVRSWGKKFVVTQSYSRRRDYVKIVSAADNNNLWKNGELMATLQTGESYSFLLTSNERSCYIETNGPSAVYLYNTTSSDGKAMGDPSMLWISPIEQQLDEITLATFSGDAGHDSSISSHYINIIVATEDTDKVYLDGTLLGHNEFTPVTGNPSYSFIRKDISYNSHHLSCIHGFNAHVYGFGDNRGYAYMVGSKAADLSMVIKVDDIIVNYNDTIVSCNLSPILFEAEINYNNYNMLWNFGDGQTSTEPSCTHTFSEHKIYEASFTLSTQEDPCLSASSTTTVFYIDTRSDSDQIITEQVCFKGPDTYIENGFNYYYDAPGYYEDSYSFIGENGCESTITLNLNVTNVLDEGTQTEIGHCDQFEWHGKTYYESGLYTDTTLNESGCLGVFHLDLDLDFTPNPTEIMPADPTNTAPHWVITATEFQINTYDFTLSDINPNCHWDTVQWSFEDESILWVLEPWGQAGKNCKVYVLNKVDDTIWLNAKVFNGCHPESDIERRYWFVCSFYGMEENTSMADTKTFDFNVTPNPNNGQMTLNFEHLTGKIDVKVFDMRGAMVDHFQIFKDLMNDTYSYTMKTNDNGLYLFVISGKEGTLTKKVILSH